jgi:hypothetical protein
MDKELWDPDGSCPHPLDVFWGQRFLRNDEITAPSDKSCPDQSMNNASRFAGEGLGAKFFPFGMGERMCPGRHFAKAQTLLTYALLTKCFDIELLVTDEWKPKVSWKHFGYGTLTPGMMTPFRIRRKRGAGV